MATIHNLEASPFQSGPAYRYLTSEDNIPSTQDACDDPAPIARVKLFDPGSNWTWYIAGYDPRRASPGGSSMAWSRSTAASTWPSWSRSAAGSACRSSATSTGSRAPSRSACGDAVPRRRGPGLPLQ